MAQDMSRRALALASTAIRSVKSLEAAFGGGASGPVSWSSITDKPSVFPPSGHTHAFADVPGLQVALDGKQAAGSYSLTSHTHSGVYALEAHDHAGVYSPVGHGHVISDTTGLQAALDGKQASLGFTPYNATNPAGYISSITGTMVTTALGYTPYNATNPSGYISSITSLMVTTALGYTPTSVVGLTGSQTVAAFKTGLSLVKADVGLGSVDNTADVAKVVLSATKLATARTLSLTGKVTAAGGTFDGSAGLAINVTAVTLVAGDIPNIAESQVTNLTTDLAAKAPLANPQFTGTAFFSQGAPTAKTATATLTIAEILTLIITVTSATAVSLTLPTGTLTDTGLLSGTLAVNEAFEWYVINLGSSTGATTLVAGTGHTIVGNAVTAIATTSRWLTRKTATNTFVTYRIA